MTLYRSEKLEAALMKAAAAFIERVSNRTSLVTVTGVKTDSKGSRAVISVSILPEEMEATTLDFLKRQRADLRTFIKEHIKLRQAPFIEVMIDQGMKNQQVIDRLVAENRKPS